MHHSLQKNSKIYSFIIVLSLGLLQFVFSDNTISNNIPTLSQLSNHVECDHCEYTLLPGETQSLGDTKYTIHSDLPEVFNSIGILYSTETILPSHGGPNDILDQIQSPQYKGIDGSFDLFLFHVAGVRDSNKSKRIVVYVKNIGQSDIIIHPKQVILTEGLIGTVHQMESNLGNRVLSNNWDISINSLQVKAGDGNIIAYSKKFASFSNDSDNSKSINCFGRVRAIVESTASSKLSPRLVVYVIALDGMSLQESQLEAAKIIQNNIGAQSGETFISMNEPPTGCKLVRCAGVFKSFQWHNFPLTLDANNLATTIFQMALPQIQSKGCPQARQTGDLILHPGYVRPDTVGNYMIDYRITLRLVNTSTSESKNVDIGFGKQDADIGLSWKLAIEDSSVLDIEVDSKEVQSGWAGPKQPALIKSFLPKNDGQITLQANSAKSVSIHFLVLGNSSLPFQLYVNPKN